MKVLKGIDGVILGKLKPGSFSSAVLYGHLPIVTVAESYNTR